MKKYAMILSTMLAIPTVGLLVVACEQTPEDIKQEQEWIRNHEQKLQDAMDKIPELKGCFVHIVESIKVVRCPLSITTTQEQQGKLTSTFTTIER